MNNITMKTWVMVGGLAISLFAGAASAQVIGGDVEIDGSNHDVIFLGGEMNVRGQVNGDIKGVAGSVRVNADVTGSVQLVGGEIDVAGSVGGDIDLAGGEVVSRANVTGDANFAGGESRISGTIGGMLNAASGHVEIDSQVGGDAKMAGGFVETSSASRFAGAAEIVGGEVHLSGEFTGPVDIEGGEIHLAGIFLDDVEIMAEEVYILDGTQVAGELRIRSPHEPVVADGTRFGSYDYEYRQFNFGAKDWDHIDFDFDAPTGVFGLFIPGAVFLLAVMALLVAPNGVASVAARFRDRPVVGGFFGFIGFALSPVFLIIMTILLAITVVGILLIPIMWLIFWPFMLLCMGFGAVAVGDMIFNRKPDEKTMGLGMRLLSTFCVVAVFAAFGAIGGLGFLAGFLLLFIGLGSWMMSLGKRREPAPAMTAQGTS
ncbi:hypothetical protein AWH62_04595 [Maricaulis sp. W15]|uniref:hypothetical protein n=1 Tax=Maricaulis sp. W15 TaxID=1772333 RepID=UPI000948A676|nr:hypothetical protein [Maricaulis sp. W15]OLF77950.1 hypothetical protein AWH62_04595 [Maricaulis sp. W15]